MDSRRVCKQSKDRDGGQKKEDWERIIDIFPTTSPHPERQEHTGSIPRRQRYRAKAVGLMAAVESANGCGRLVGLLRITCSRHECCSAGAASRRVVGDADEPQLGS
jgi:hypothetical protein